MGIDTTIPVAYLRECFDVDFEMGTLAWKRRPREHFVTARAWTTWNTRFSGKRAGTPHGEGYLVVRFTFGGKAHHPLGHRIIWALATGAWPQNQIDHRNGFGTDNRLSNLLARPSDKPKPQAPRSPVDDWPPFTAMSHKRAG
jgi:hypothetical protein